MGTSTMTHLRYKSDFTNMINFINTYTTLLKYKFNYLLSNIFLVFYFWTKSQLLFIE